MSVAAPAPAPRLLVGVLTAIRTMSASLIDLATSAVKKRFGWRPAMGLETLSPHWLPHSEVGVEASDTSGVLEDVEFVTERGLVSMAHSLAPSRAMRRMWFKPGS